MDAAIQAANDRMVYVTGDEEEIWAYERYLMALSDRTSEMNYAREEGREEGKLEIARKMKEMGFSPEQIQAATGLSIE